MRASSPERRSCFLPVRAVGRTGRYATVPAPVSDAADALPCRMSPRLHFSTVRAFIAACLLLVAAPLVARAQLVGPDVRVSPSAGAQVDPAVAAWGDVVVAAWTVGVSEDCGTAAIGWGWSSDGGMTWKDGGLLPTRAVPLNAVGGEPALCGDQAGQF